MQKKNKITIGTYGLGCLAVKVEAVLDSEGGSYFMRQQPTIQVGFKDNNLGEVVGILLHEALEMYHMVKGHKYRAVPVSSFDSADVTFMFNHSEHSRACADVGTFVCEVIGPLGKAFNKNCQKKGKK